MPSGRLAERHVTLTQQTDYPWDGKVKVTVAATRPVKIRAVPYCLWDNRAPGTMTVYLPRA